MSNYRTPPRKVRESSSTVKQVEASDYQANCSSPSTYLSSFFHCCRIQCYDPASHPDVASRRMSPDDAFDDLTAALRRQCDGGDGSAGGGAGGGHGEVKRSPVFTVYCTCRLVVALWRAGTICCVVCRVHGGRCCGINISVSIRGWLRRRLNGKRHRHRRCSLLRTIFYFCSNSSLLAMTPWGKRKRQQSKSAPRTRSLAKHVNTEGCPTPLRLIN